MSHLDDALVALNISESRWELAIRGGSHSRSRGLNRMPDSREIRENVVMHLYRHTTLSTSEIAYEVCYGGHSSILAVVARVRARGENADRPKTWIPGPPPKPIVYTPPVPG